MSTKRSDLTPPPASDTADSFPDWRPLIFSAFIFLAGVGGMFFRMARDNDDIVRAIFVFVVGAAATLILARKRLQVPASIALPCLGFTAAMFLSSFVTVYAPESMKEFFKIGIYMLVFITLASCAGMRTGIRVGPVHYLAAAGLTAAGFTLGYLHAHDPSLRTTFLLWSAPQVLASLGTSCLFCGAACLVLASGSVRRIAYQALILQAVIACALGISQFYGFDWFRPWDPKQPYDIYIRSLSPQFLIKLASVMGGTLKTEGAETLLVLPRILGIYGNPDFFAPFLLQFIPLTVSVAVFYRARLWRALATILTALLLATLLLTNVRGAFVGLIALAPFLGILLGYASGPQNWREARGFHLRIAGVAAAVASLLALIGLFFIKPSTGLYLAAVMLLFAYVHAHAFYLLARLAPRLTKFLIAAGALLILSYVGAFLVLRQTTGVHVGAIEERLVKYRMAAEMWERSPVVGEGLNSYKTFYPRLQQKVRLHHGWPFERLGSSGTQENRTHNDLAQMLAESGVVGAGMFLWLMAALLLGSLRALERRREMAPEKKAELCGLFGAVLAILVYMLPNFPFHIVSSAATFWIIAGLLASHLALESSDPPRALPVRTARLLTAGGTLTIVLVTVFSARLLWGTLEHKKGNAFFEQVHPPQPERATIHFERAVRLDPTNPHIRYEYGAMCFNSSLANPGVDPELPAKARGLLLESLKRGFIGEDLAFGLGHLAESAGDFPEALKWYNIAVELKERHEFARKGRLRILLREMPEAELARSRGRFREARELYAAALKYNPGNWMAALHLGGLSIAPFGDVANGIKYLEEASRLAPNEISVQLSLFNGYMATRRVPEARKALAAAVVLDPEEPQVKAAAERFRQVDPGGTSAPSPSR